MFYHAIGTFIIFFYVDKVGLSPALAAISKALAYGVWNAINDPLAGYLSDRTSTRWGRRIPYIMIGATLTLIFFILLFSPPVGGRPLADPHNLWIFAYLMLTIAVLILCTLSFPSHTKDCFRKCSISWRIELRYPCIGNFSRIRFNWSWHDRSLRLDRLYPRRSHGTGYTNGL